MVKNNEFLENAHIFDNHYGTPKKIVDDEMANGNDVLFDIDWQGARQLINHYGRENIVTIFILPPSIEELHQRLRNRASDSEEVVLKRMQMAKSEVSHYDEYDFILINQDLETTYQKISKIIDSNRIKRADQSKAKEFTRLTLNMVYPYLLADTQSKCFMFLTDLTTSYYADEIINWIKTKLK